MKRLAFPLSAAFGAVRVHARVGPDGADSRIRTRPGEILVALPERFAGREGSTAHVLGQARDASGATCQDGPLEGWTRSTAEARLEADGEPRPSTQHP